MMNLGFGFTRILRRQKAEMVSESIRNLSEWEGLVSCAEGRQF